MNPRREDWARAFLSQGRSDLRVYDLLVAQPEETVPACHALHYLQMACEKIAKAYRIRDTSAQLSGPNNLLRRHVGFVKFMSAFLLSPALRDAYAGRTAQLRQVSRTTLAIARQVQKLAPAVDDETSPENVEYPWQLGSEVIAPCDHRFAHVALLRAPGGATFLKLVRRAVDEFEDLHVR